MEITAKTMMKTAKLLTLLLYALSALAGASHAAEPANFTVTRLGDGPIITPDMDTRMGGNIHGGTRDTHSIIPKIWHSGEY